MFRISDIIWNRACEGGGDAPRPGDRHLASLLLYHGAAMNGGMFHATECLSVLELQKAKDGYAYLGLTEVVALIGRTEGILKSTEDLDDYETEFVFAYGRVADDSIVNAKFLQKFVECAGDFAPVH